MDYGDMSENALLKTIVEEEMYSYEARYGKAECPQAKKMWFAKICRLILLLLLVAILIKIISQDSIFMMMFSSMKMMYTIGIILLIKYIKNGGQNILPDFFPGSMNPVIHYIMHLAKKNPDVKIKDIIYKVCENTGSVWADDLNGVMTKEQERRKKRIVIGILAIFIVGILGLGWYYGIPHVSYTEAGSGYILNNYRLGFSTEGNAVIPETHNGKPVIGIGEGAFKSNLFLKTVELPNTILYIQGEAFKNCRRLEWVYIPEGVTELRGNTFEGCSSLKKISLPDSITEIHGECFRNCDELSDIELPRHITEIKGNTFEGCSSLKSIVIPQGVTRIGGHAFYGCSSLVEVNIPSTVTYIGSSAFRKCDNLINISLPVGVEINERAFKDSPTVIHYYSS